MIEYEIFCVAGGVEYAIVADEAMTDYDESYHNGSDPCMYSIAENAFEYFRANPSTKVITLTDADGCDWTCVKTSYRISD